MRVQDLKNLDAKELAARLTALKGELYGTSEAVRTGKEKNHGKLKMLRRDIARVKTVLEPLLKEGK